MHVTYGDREILIKRMTIDEMEQVGDFLDLMKKSATKETENILPRPMIRNKHGEFLEEYTPRGFFAELQAEIFEAIEKNFEWFLYKSGVTPFKNLSISVAKDNFAEEIGKIITICISFLNAIGYDEEKRSELFAEVNEKNEKRGYFRNS